MNVRREYEVLRRRFGVQRWWPVQETPDVGAAAFEMCIGAILTQNTSWQNVEKAIESLRRANALSLHAIGSMRLPRLQSLVRSSGYYRQKAKRLKTFSRFVTERYGGNFKMMFHQPLKSLREELLSINGVGRETADSMLLYAGGKPIFVIDAYTRRFCKAHGVVFDDYDDYRQYFEERVPKRTRFYQEYHALIVAWGKEQSKRKTAR